MLDPSKLDRPAYAPPPLALRRSLGRLRRPRRCQWIDGEPNRRDACKCGLPVAPHSSYCEAHSARALLVPFLLSLLMESAR
jgi:hypothetical protein